MPFSDQQLLIGVDGGGSGCRVALGTPSTGIIARTIGGRANVTSDPEGALKNIHAAINTAAQQAGVNGAALKDAVVHLGLAGVMTQADSERTAAAFPLPNVQVTDDRPTAVMGALAGDDGFLLAVGTGSFVAARKHETFRYIGGWGLQVSDQASGAWLGRAALKQVLLCHDGLADHCEVTRALFAEFGDDPNAIVTFCATAQPGDYAGFAPVVMSSRDPFAQALMARGADYLTRGLAALGFQPGDTLCLSGGVGPHYAPYLPAAYLSGQIAPRGSALDGAFLLAKAVAMKTESR